MIALVFGAIRGVLVEDHVETSLGSLSGAAELLAARDGELGPGGGGIRRYPYGTIHISRPQEIALQYLSNLPYFICFLELHRQKLESS